MMFVMLNHVFYFCLGFSFLLFFDNFITKEFTLNLIINTSYNCIYYYSKLHIFFSKVKNEFIEANPNLRYYINKINFKNNEKEIITFVKTGKLFSTPWVEPIGDCEDYDFIIKTFPNKNILRKIFYTKYEINNIFLESDIKFLLIELKIGENIYKIDLKTENFNYYLVDNKFTKDFFIFYIRIHLNKNYELNDNDKYSLKILDHNVNNIEIDFTNKNECIVLEKTGYKIYNHHS
jgi:hypothetical protein